MALLIQSTLYGYQVYGGHFVISKGSIHQEDITTPNFYVFNNAVLKYVKVKLREV